MGMFLEEEAGVKMELWVQGPKGLLNVVDWEGIGRKKRSWRGL